MHFVRHTARALLAAALLAVTALPVLSGAVASAAADATSAPVLTVDGTTLRWTAIAGASRYELATMVPGRAATYTRLDGTSVTPAAVPGKTVSYGMRTYPEGTRWAREVQVTYPAAGTSTASRSVSVQAAADTATPAPSASTGLRFGFNAGGLDLKTSAQAMQRLGARHARVEFAIGSSVDELRPVIAAYADRGIDVVPLAGFHGRLPSSGEAQNLANWAREFGPGGAFWAGRSDGDLAIDSIEFGNETSYSYQGTNGRGGEYAQRFRDAYSAVQGANSSVGLLAQADDAGSGSSAWVDAMFDAVPDLASMVAGWTVHPYGPESRGDRRIDNLIRFTAARGAPSSIPIDITEWGLATDDGRCLSDNYEWDSCMDFGEAADALTSTVSRLKRKYGSRIRYLHLYQAADQGQPGSGNGRELWFGALKRDMSDKGAFTAAIRAQVRAGAR